MYVVVARAVNDQQVSGESFGEVDGRAIVIALHVLLRQAHVALLIDGVVMAFVGDRSDSDAGLVESGRAKHEIEGVRSPTAPTPDGEPRHVDIAVFFAQFPDGVRLLCRRKHAYTPVDHLAPFPAFWRRSSLIVEADNDVSLARDQ